MKTQKLTIIRGLPGAGKTTLAKELAKAKGAVLIEPDGLLTDCYGEYHYSPSAFEAEKEKCLEIVRDCAKLERNVIYAGVLPTRRDVERICTAFRIAVECGRKAEVRVKWIPMSVEESIVRNVHRVREEDIRRMADTWEAWPTEEIVKTDIREL